jgi:8-oxo-dGTP pyrophosphatase MutT (NUDIX family)
VQRTRWQDVERALQLRPPARVEVAVASKAAVALVLRDGRDGLELLFIHRAEHPEDPWSGQMAFPGGRFEPGDGDLSRTAVRETQEEIGLDLDASAQLLGSLDETRAVSRMRSVDLTITPYVFRAGERAQAGWHTSPEVRSVHWIPLDDLIGSRHRALMDYPYEDGLPLKFPCFKVEGNTIWGLTYRMFSNLQSLLEDLER